MKVWAKAIFAIATLVAFAPAVLGRLSAETTRKLGADCIDKLSYWSDSDGDDCDDYKRNDWCDVYGGGLKNFGMTAKQVRFE